jgi:hypothetical protein
MHFHSVDDPRALYNGGLGPPFPATSTRVEHPPVEQQLAKWIARDGCRSTPTVEKRLIGKGEDAGNTATKLVYAPCSSGANVVLWKLSGSGHIWPGRDSYLPQMLGKPTHLIDANEEMWTFFRGAPKRRQAAALRGPSGEQKQFPFRFSSFKQAVRFGGVAQREIAIDAQLQASLADPGEQFAGAP